MFFQNSHILVEEVQKRWKYLRDRYTREKKKEKNKSGTGSEDETEKDKWEHYASMHFLNDFIKHRK